MAFAPTDALFDTVLDFLTPTSDQIIACQMPEPLQERLSELLAQNRSGTLDITEQIELEESLPIKRFMRRLKLKAQQKLGL